MASSRSTTLGHLDVAHPAAVDTAAVVALADRDARRRWWSPCRRCRACACGRSPGSRARRRSGATCTATSATIASKISRRDRDAAVALGERHHADRQRDPGLDLRQRRAAPRTARERPSRTSSEEPPPMSNRMTPSASGSISGVQPVAASSRLGLAVDDLELEPDLLARRGHGSRRRSSAARQASVAISRARVTPRFASCRGRCAAPRPRARSPAR